MSKRIAVDLDDKLWWSLAETADSKGATVPALLAKIIADYTSGRLKPPSHVNKGPDTLLAQVVHLHAAGYTDVRIAEVLGCHDQTVADKRRTLGLEANGRKQA